MGSARTAETDTAGLGPHELPPDDVRPALRDRAVRASARDVPARVRPRRRLVPAPRRWRCASRSTTRWPVLVTHSNIVAGDLERREAASTPWRARPAVDAGGDVPHLAGAPALAALRRRDPARAGRRRPRLQGDADAGARAGARARTGAGAGAAAARARAHPAHGRAAGERRGRPPAGARARRGGDGGSPGVPARPPGAR